MHIENIHGVLDRRADRMGGNSAEKSERRPGGLLVYPSKRLIC